MYCVALIVYDDPKSRFSGLQTFPFFFQMLFDGSTFAFKCQKIKKFYVEIDEAFLKVNGQASFYHSYKYFLIYATVNGVLGFISCVGGSLLFLFSGRPAVLTYTPYNDGFCFYVIWTLQASFFAYSGVLNFLMDAFINGMLVSLSSYVKAVRIYLKKKEIHDMREMIELDLELRG
ncbi:hypothetical protein PVAND_012877 [Polypedilum vanderplanki]|uniref:Uncharacterized protein n=1 Tax=Polypedilum vanderplanki TaxID=319348 RepID=A0A9J6CNX6_POLVA|nr:hypothetical protein PVAND_012877 [Polypedilum vanderplanki]